MSQRIPQVGLLFYIIHLLCMFLCIDAIMDMLNSDKCRQAIMKQQSNHPRQTEKVKKAIKAFKKSEDYCDGSKKRQ